MINKHSSNDGKIPKKSTPITSSIKSDEFEKKTSKQR